MAEVKINVLFHFVLAFFRFFVNELWLHAQT